MVMSLADVLRHVLPDGTRVETALSGQAPRDATDWQKVPNFPPDLFAIAAYLLDHAGAYSYIVPESAGGLAGDCHVIVTVREIAAWKEAAVQIREATITPPQDFPSDVPPLVEDLWQVIWDAAFVGHAIIYARVDSSVRAPGWWKAAYGLLMIADEACVDVGYDGSMVGDAGEKLSWIAKYVKLSSIFLLHKNRELERRAGDVRIAVKHVTISPLADHSVLCVQPKGRTPRVGCTMRSLSHNLALLPPAGFVTTHWQRPLVTPPDDDDANLNLLLVPLPYTIHPDWFDVGEDDATGTGWFDLHPRWLREANRIETFTLDLVKEARLRVAGPVHGVLFPEYALNWPLFKSLRRSLAEVGVEFLIAGSCQDFSRDHGDLDISSEETQGNYVLVSQFTRSGGVNASVTTGRPKHHRWGIYDGQPEAYGLSSRFRNPKLVYWERIGLPRREIDLHVFRSSSVFATMICEDLARSDPCHQVLRSLGPNIVFVLLMDGPQLPTRWPARYASTLADDPGSAVLTFTSLGLVDRTNGTAAFSSSQAIALWKDDTGRTREIICPVSAQGVVISLKSQLATDRTLDGRVNSDTRRWLFDFQRPVRLGSEHAGTTDKVMWAGVVGS